MTTSANIPPTQLPDTIRAYLAAHQAGATDAAARTFTADAVVVDDGQTFEGHEGVRDFLAKAGSEYTYTTELIKAQRIDDTHWVAVNRVEGNFPGGLVVLDYAFALEDNLISDLTISAQA
jgi:hypothetical protein